jgi:hypothetical protein
MSLCPQIDRLLRHSDFPACPCCRASSHTELGPMECVAVSPARVGRHASPPHTGPGRGRIAPKYSRPRPGLVGYRTGSPPATRAREWRWLPSAVPLATVRRPARSSPMEISVPASESRESRPREPPSELSCSRASSLPCSRSTPLQGALQNLQGALPRKHF